MDCRAVCLKTWGTGAWHLLQPVFCRLPFRPTLHVICDCVQLLVSTRKCHEPKLNLKKSWVLLTEHGSFTYQPCAPSSARVACISRQTSVAPVTFQACIRRHVWGELAYKVQGRAANTCLVFSLWGCVALDWIAMCWTDSSWRCPRHKRLETTHLLAYIIGWHQEQLCDGDDRPPPGAPGCLLRPFVPLYPCTGHQYWYAWGM